MVNNELDLFDEPDSHRVKQAKAIEAAETDALNAIRRIVELAERSNSHAFGAAALAKLTMLANNAQRRLWQDPPLVRTEPGRGERRRR